MKVKNLIILSLTVLLLLPAVAYGQTWDEDQAAKAKDELKDKFQLKEELSFRQEGALEEGSLQIFPANVEITEGALESGLTVALVRYGDENLTPLFVASLPSLNPPYGAALISTDGEVLWVNSAEIQGKEDGPQNPNLELLKEEEETYQIGLNFQAASIKTEVPKNAP